MNLYLIRHAIAEEQHSAGDDSQRALTEKGGKKMRSIAKGLRILGVEFDAILSSPYLRARETAEILGNVFKMKTQVVCNDNLMPGGDPAQLLTEVKEKYFVDNLAIVGHEPFLSRLVGLLTAHGSPMSVEMKKGGICRLYTDDLHHATMQWLMTPGVLVEISEE